MRASVRVLALAQTLLPPPPPPFPRRVPSSPSDHEVIDPDPYGQDGDVLEGQWQALARAVDRRGEDLGPDVLRLCGLSLGAGDRELRSRTQATALHLWGAADIVVPWSALSCAFPSPPGTRLSQVPG